MIEVRVHRSIQEIPAQDWDALDGASDVPFLGWTWLDALERTGCVGEEAGWLPHHLSFWDGADGARRMIGAAPCYVKDNSEGEFVLDWAWDSAAPRFRVRYYPKLWWPPVHPAPARVLAADPAERRACCGGPRRSAGSARRWEISSAHVLFRPRGGEVLAAAGMAHRHGGSSVAQRGYDFETSSPLQRQAPRPAAPRAPRVAAQASRWRAARQGPDPAVVDGRPLYLATVDKSAGAAAT